MALFGGANAQQGLALAVSALGTEETVGKLNRVAGAAQRVGTSAERTSGRGMARMSQGFSRLRGMASSAIGIFGRLSGMLGLGGAIGIGVLIGETMSVERNLHRIAFQGGRSADQMLRMRRAMNEISGATGKTRAEVLAAISAAEDFGIPLDDAEKYMEKIVLWSDLLGVNTDQASGALGALKRSVGDVADVPQLMSMLNSAALNAGMDEGLMMSLVQKLAPQLQGIAGIADITSFFQAIAGMGEELAGDPRQIVAAFKTLNKSMNDPKTRRAWEKVGVTGDNAAEILMSMAQKLAVDATALDNAKVPDEVKAIALAMSENGERINKMGGAVDKAAGSTDALFAALEAHKNDPEVIWAGTLERLKQAMDPIINGVVGWLADPKNRDALVGLVQDFAQGLADVVGWIHKMIFGVEGKPLAGGYGAGAGVVVRSHNRAGQEAAAGMSIQTPSYYMPTAEPSPYAGTGPSMTPVGGGAYRNPAPVVNVYVASDVAATATTRADNRSEPSMSGGGSEFFGTGG